jgi:phosphoribosyl-ATP pyrophosphohydrolase
MTDVLYELERVIQSRKTEPPEGSYTAYLFDKGLDKILKKVAEECGETIIAAKNNVSTEVVGEVADLLYHLMVMLAQLGIPFADLEEELSQRALKIGNLKTFHTTDHLS